VACGICQEICKRGVKLGCCSCVGCRACATKFITREKKCWNSGCEALVTTKDLINDEELRKRVEVFLAANANKEAEAKKLEEKKAQEEAKKIEEEKKKKEELEKQEEKKRMDNEAKLKAEQEAEKANKARLQAAAEAKKAQDAKTKAAEEAKKAQEAKTKAEESRKRVAEERSQAGSNAKLAKNDANGTKMVESSGLTIEMMRERNEEFNSKLNEVERKCNELRYGAQLELLFTFGEKKAKCRLCSQELQGDFVVLKHVQMKHKDVYNNIKTVLGSPNLNGLNLCLHKAIKAEFVFAQKEIFPCVVSY